MKLQIQNKSLKINEIKNLVENGAITEANIHGDGIGLGYLIFFETPVSHIFPQTQRGKHKSYKTLEAAMNEVKRLGLDGFHFSFDYEDHDD